MNIRRLHKIIGVILLLPFLGWAITGVIFFIKPGYGSAYEALTPKTYPMDSTITISPDPSWYEFRYFRTVLGDHLIVRTHNGWAHLNPANNEPRKMPTAEETRLLLTDAISANPQRYGEIISISEGVAKTNTGIDITMDWNKISFQQRGKDTSRIDLLYKIHYLQWTGLKNLDKVIGIIGLALIVVLTILGAKLMLKKTDIDDEFVL